MVQRVADHFGCSSVSTPCGTKFTKRKISLFVSLSSHYAYSFNFMIFPENNLHLGRMSLKRWPVLGIKYTRYTTGFQAKIHSVSILKSTKSDQGEIMVYLWMNIWMDKFCSIIAFEVAFKKDLQKEQNENKTQQLQAIQVRMRRQTGVKKRSTYAYCDCKD